MKVADRPKAIINQLPFINRPVRALAKAGLLKKGGYYDN